ncbi:hypothetical protein DFH07DRAFT_11074 [Mycena maculata]|uniref:Uncharacterized protein n=1 Tax=Mycena maculata TaxID=230809 RepID=A0AAD7NVJ9_9AGAR|nr:hypothetical protein DFH07DRAFT_11074 [Mycena maculata]
MSGTADALLVLTSVLAVVCRLHFGKGLAHFLRVCADLEGEDFTPVYFSKKGDDDDPDYDFKDKNNSEFNAAEIPILHFSSGEQVQRHEPPLERKPSRISLFFSNSQSPNDTIKLSSTPDLYQSAMQFKSPAPVLVQPVARSSSKSSSIHSTRQATRPPDILTGPASPSVLPPISVSPISFEYPRAERPGQARAMAEPTKPAQAVVRSTSMPRRGVPAGGYGLPRRPSDRAKGNGNYF